MKSFLVIGMGRFGTAVAQELTELGQEVLAIDENVESVQRIAEDVTQVMQGDAQDEAVLGAIGVRNFDCCIAVSYTHLTWRCSMRSRPKSSVQRCSRFTNTFPMRRRRSCRPYRHWPTAISENPLLVHDQFVRKRPQNGVFDRGKRTRRLKR